MKFNEKLNKEKGSVLLLAIIVLSLSSIAIITISSQINNQIKFNQRVYVDMRYKYMAESGIENSIYDIQKQLENKQLNKITDKNNHKNCPKVKYESDGTPEIGSNHIQGDTFNYLIYKEILGKEITPTHQSALFESLKPFFGTENVLWGNFNDLWRLSGYMYAGHTSYFDEFKRIVDEFIDEIDKVIVKIQNMNIGTTEQINKAIKGLNNMKENLIEIKCRLGLLIDEPKDIKVSTYTYYIEDNQLKYNKDENSKTISVKDSNEVEIDIISYSAENIKLIDDKKYTIKSKIKFILSDLNDVKYEIISYEQQRN